MLRVACRTSLIAISTLVIFLPATSAVAQSSQGATVTVVDQCVVVDAFGELLCQEGRVVSNWTQTPSGLVSVNMHYNIDFTRTGGFCPPVEGNDTGSEHTLLDLNDDTLQEGHTLRHLFTISSSCGFTPTFACEYTVMVHQVGESFQFGRQELSCVEQ